MDGSVNRPPQWASPMLSPVQLAEGATQTVSLMATDPDGDTLTYSLVTPPSFATVSGATLTLSPDYASAGSWTLTVRVSDGQASADATLSVAVTNVNREPEIAYVPPIVVTPGDTRTVTLVATDPDGDAVSLSLAPGTPTWVTLSGATLTITAPAAPTTASVELRAQDNGTPPLTGYRLVNINVATLAGSVSINGGATYATSRSVSVALQSSAATEVRLSGDGSTWSSWSPFNSSATLSFTFTAGEGVRTVFAEFRDGSGAVVQASDAITVDTIAPVATLDVDNGRVATNQSTVNLTIIPSEQPVQQAITVVHSSVATPNFPGAFNNFASPTSVYVGTNPGGRKICVWLRDAAGNRSATPTIYTLSYDATAPTVVSISPSHGSSGVTRSVRPVVMFSEVIDATSISGATVSLNGVVTTAFPVGDTGGQRGVMLSPAAPLAANTAYTVTVTGVRDRAGNVLAGTSTSTFTTGDFGALSALTPPETTLAVATGSTNTLVVSRHDAVTETETRAALWDGAWSERVVGEGAAQAVAQGDTLVVGWSGGGAATVFSGGQVRQTDYALPGRFTASPLGITQVSDISQSYPYSFRVSVLDGGAWVPTDGGVSDITVSPVAFDSNDAGFAVVHGRLLGVGNYAAQVRHFDGAAWRSATLGGGSGFPGGLLVAGSGDRFVACWRSGSVASGCNTLNPATGAWDARARPAGLDSVTGNGDGFALASYVAPTATVETSSGGTWQPGGLSVTATAPPQVVARPGGFVALWRDGDALRASTFDGTSWTSALTLASGTTAAPLRLTSAKTIGATTLVTWVSDFNVFARAWDGASWSTVSTLNTTERAGDPVVGALAGAPAVFWPSGPEVEVRRWQGGGFTASSTVATTALSPPPSEPKVTFNDSGAGLAVWHQNDGGRPSVFAAHFDGAAWSAAFRVAANAYQPRVTWGAGRFVVGWLAGPANAYRMGRPTAATYTLAGGLTAPVSVSSSDSAQLGLASGPSGFLLAWSAQAPVSAVQSATSADGVAWTAPVTVETAPRAVVEVARAGNGFVITSTDWSASPYVSNLRVWNGATWSAATARNGECKVAGGPDGAAAVCRDLNYNVQVAAWNLATWSTASMGQVSSGHHAVAAGPGGSFRVMFGDRTATFTSGAWSSSVALGASGADALACDGTEYFGVGARQDASYVQNLVAFRSAAGVMSSLGIVEGMTGEVWDVAAGATPAGFFTLWTQDELPSGDGRRRLNVRRW